MDKVSDVSVGDSVFVVSKAEKGAVTRIGEQTIVVLLLASEVEVAEGDFERR